MNIGIDKEIELHFGAMSDDIKIQLESQGITLPEKDCDTFEKCKFGITILNLHGILTDNETSKCRRKLFNKIMKEIEDKRCTVKQATRNAKQLSGIDPEAFLKDVMENNYEGWKAKLDELRGE